MEEKQTRIRPVGTIKLTKTSKAHIPELIRRETETQPGEEIPFVINAATVLLYNPKLDLEQLLASLEVLKQDLKLRFKEKTP
ncbi:MAG: hypothetical protein ACQXXG_09490 [Candidatus Bathyarchaeia archaeon]|jgi:hypothetical protein|nr:hypothetical protein [Candidatus Bathyarchaeota archaeon]